jgi:hypothetical protein
MAGETVDKSAQSYAYRPHGKGAVACLANSFECVTAELQLADMWLLGYIPSGATPIFGILKTDDLDTGSEALTFDLVLGSTVFGAGIVSLANAKAGIGIYGDMAAVTGKTAVYLKCHAAATTAAAGTVNAALYYIAT